MNPKFSSLEQVQQQLRKADILYKITLPTFVFTQIFLGLHDFIDITMFDSDESDFSITHGWRAVIVWIEMILCVIQFLFLLYLSVYFLLMSFEFQKLI
jgi:hypothetical protein